MRGISRDMFCHWWTIKCKHSMETGFTQTADIISLEGSDITDGGICGGWILRSYLCADMVRQEARWAGALSALWPRSCPEFESAAGIPIGSLSSIWRYCSTPIMF